MEGIANITFKSRFWKFSVSVFEMGAASFSNPSHASASLLSNAAAGVNSFPLPPIRAAAAFFVVLILNSTALHTLHVQAAVETMYNTCY